MVMLAERSQVAIKQEAVAGTAETLAAADVRATTDVPTFETDIEMIDRNILSASLSRRGFVAGARFARIGFKMHLRGTSGAPADPGNLPDYVVPMRGCGLVSTVSGTPPNEQTETKPVSSFVIDETTGPYCTVAIYNDGKRYMIHGAVGNLKLTFRIAAPTLAEFDYMGVYNAPTDTALLVPSYTSIIEPPFAGAALSVLGYGSAKIGQLTFDLGNQIAMRPNPNVAAGYHTAQITGRRPVGTLDPEEELAATKNFWAEWIALTTGALNTGTYPSGGTNYNQFSFSLPKIQYTGVGFDVREGVRTAPLEFAALANSDAGDDEASLIQT